MSSIKWSYGNNNLPAFKQAFTNMDKFFNSFYFSPTERLVPMDVVERDESFELRIAIPGFTKDDIKVDVKAGTLLVEAKRADKDEDENYIYKGLS